MTEEMVLSFSETVLAGKTVILRKRFVPVLLHTEFCKIPIWDSKFGKTLFRCSVNMVLALSWSACYMNSL